MKKSLYFYSKILGFHQIRRPNIEREGAWLTLGNIDLHLVYGKPVDHSGEDLIGNHISFETKNLSEVLQRLKEMGIPFKTFVITPQADEVHGNVTQYFFQDPDGYYVEICNCDILEEFCYS